MDNTIKLWDPKAKTFSLVTQQIQTVLKALKNNTSVTALDLSGNTEIIDAILDPLLEIFTPGFLLPQKINKTLKTIDLRGTSITTKTVRELKKTIQTHPLSVEVLANCPVEWMMIYFLIVFCRANRNSPFADSGWDLCKHGEIGSFLNISSGFFSQPKRAHQNPPSSKNMTFSPS